MPGVGFRVQAASRPATSGVWQAPVELDHDGSNPQVAFGPGGTPIAVWDDVNGVQAAAHPAGSASWQAPVDLTAPGQTALEPQLAVDPAGDAVAVWDRVSDANTIVQAASRPATLGAWQAPVDLSAPTTTLVPDVIDWSKRLAGPEITAAGLVPRYTGATTATSSYVAAETPAPGTRVPVGSTVTSYLKPGSPNQ